MVFGLNGKQRNFIFFITLGLTLAVITAAWTIGNHQDRIYRQNYQRYQQATSLMGQGKYGQALQIFNTLDADSQTGYQVLYMSAFCELQTGDYNGAALHMQMAREARPALVQDQKFLERYGVILLYLGDYPQASLYLRESLNYPNDSSTVQEAHKYLTEINKKPSGGR
jgi:hypothetical protein